MTRLFPWLTAHGRDAGVHTKSYPANAAFMIPFGQPIWMRREATKFADEGYRKNVIAHRAIAMVATAAAHASGCPE